MGRSVDEQLPQHRPPQTFFITTLDYAEIFDSGPALAGKLLVLSTWMPACCSPLKGVMTGLVLPGSQPSLNGTLGSLNQRPRWYWCVGEKVVVPPGETEKVSTLKMPFTVTLPEPLEFVWRSLWYQETPKGAPGVWMMKRSGRQLKFNFP
jgi:hypothetical protein